MYKHYVSYIQIIDIVIHYYFTTYLQQFLLFISTFRVEISVVILLSLWLQRGGHLWQVLPDQFFPLQQLSNHMLTAAGVWPDCQQETDLFCWAKQSAVVGRKPTCRIGFSAAADINNHVADFYLLSVLPPMQPYQAEVCGYSFAGIAGSNPAEDKDLHLLCLLCVVYVVASARADHSLRGVLLRVMLCVWVGGGRVDGCVCVCVCVCVCARLVVCDVDTSKTRRSRPDLGCGATARYNYAIYTWSCPSAYVIQQHTMKAYGH